MADPDPGFDFPGDDSKDAAKLGDILTGSHTLGDNPLLLDTPGKDENDRTIADKPPFFAGEPETDILQFSYEGLRPPSAFPPAISKPLRAGKNAKKRPSLDEEQASPSAGDDGTNIGNSEGAGGSPDDGLGDEFGDPSDELGVDELGLGRGIDTGTQAGSQDGGFRSMTDNALTSAVMQGNNNALLNEIQEKERDSAAAKNAIANKLKNMTLKTNFDFEAAPDEDDFDASQHDLPEQVRMNPTTAHFFESLYGRDYISLKRHNFDSFKNHDTFASPDSNAGFRQNRFFSDRLDEYGRHTKFHIPMKSVHKTGYGGSKKGKGAHPDGGASAMEVARDMRLLHIKHEFDIPSGERGWDRKNVGDSVSNNGMSKTIIGRNLEHCGENLQFLEDAPYLPYLPVESFVSNKKVLSQEMTRLAMHKIGMRAGDMVHLGMLNQCEQTGSMDIRINKMKRVIARHLRRKMALNALETARKAERQAAVEKRLAEDHHYKGASDDGKKKKKHSKQSDKKNLSKKDIWERMLDRFALCEQRKADALRAKSDWTDFCDDWNYRAKPIVLKSEKHLRDEDKTKNSGFKSRHTFLYHKAMQHLANKVNKELEKAEEVCKATNEEFKYQPRNRWSIMQSDRNEWNQRLKESKSWRLTPDWRAKGGIVRYGVAIDFNPNKSKWTPDTYQVFLRNAVGSQTISDPLGCATNSTMKNLMYKSAVRLDPPPFEEFRDLVLDRKESIINGAKRKGEEEYNFLPQADDITSPRWEIDQKLKMLKRVTYEHDQQVEEKIDRMDKLFHHRGKLPNMPKPTSKSLSQYRALAAELLKKKLGKQYEKVLGKYEPMPEFESLATSEYKAKQESLQKYGGSKKKTPVHYSPEGHQRLSKKHKATIKTMKMNQQMQKQLGQVNQQFDNEGHLIQPITDDDDNNTNNTEEVIANDLGSVVDQDRNMRILHDTAKFGPEVMFHKIGDQPQTIMGVDAASLRQEYYPPQEEEEPPEEDP